MEAASTPTPRPSRLLLGLPLAALALFVGSLLGLAVMLGGTSGCQGGEAVGGLGAKVPRRLVPLYTQAAERYQLGSRGPSVLAAINFVETSFGTNVATSEAGAEGWMAFLPSTFAVWGVDGSGDGVKDIFNAADAIFSAANYLHDSGAPGDWREAIFAYNHADWYVEKVLRYAKRFDSGEAASQESSCPAAAAAPNEAIARMLAEAARLSALRPHTEYVWGGSHGETPTPADGPFDCSSAVSHILQVGGFENPTMDTVALLRWGEPGPGRWVTIFDKPYGGDAHTFFRFAEGLTPSDERYWGTSGFWFEGHGPGFIPERIFSAGYLAGFIQRHPPGL
ncbi:MAG: lytic transglycosylase domain-containing protein [Solirubrobacterales bacterium]